MGEYADDQLRQTIKRLTGVDPGPMGYDDLIPKHLKKNNCKYCSKPFNSVGAKMRHMQAKHAAQLLKDTP